MNIMHGPAQDTYKWFKSSKDGEDFWDYEEWCRLLTSAPDIHTTKPVVPFILCIYVLVFLS